MFSDIIILQDQIYILKPMKNQIVNQFLFKINQMKLNEDLKILNQLKNDFHDHLNAQEKFLQKEMLSLCNIYNIKQKIKLYDPCIKYNKSLLEKYKNFGLQIQNQMHSHFHQCQSSLKTTALSSHQKQAFYMIVDVQQNIDSKIQLLKQESYRIKASKFIQNIMINENVNNEKVKLNTETL